MKRTAVSILQGCLVAAFALFVAMPVQAQGISSGDVTEWSAFAPRQIEPERLSERTDLMFKGIAHEGPFSPQREAALSADERQLLSLMQQSRWAEALVHLKTTQPDLNRRDESGLTPLSLAARAGQLDLVREMIRQGAVLDQAGVAGMTPLGAAAFQGHDLVLNDLLRAGARVDVPGATGQLPLHLACATGRLRAVNLLTAAGADWREPNRQGRNALEEAAYFGRVDAMQALVAAGASLSEPDVHGLNAVHAAAFGVQPEALAWLRARGVPVPSVLSQLLIDQIDNPPPQP